MSKRPNPYVKYPGLVKLLIGLSQAVQGMGLEKSLIQLVEIRASQIIGRSMPKEREARYIGFVHGYDRKPQPCIIDHLRRHAGPPSRTEDFH